MCVRPACALLPVLYCLQVTDAVYMGLGRVLTISGRTIRPEAQDSPVPAQEAEGAIDKFLEQVGALPQSRFVLVFSGGQGARTVHNPEWRVAAVRCGADA